jgi:elongation factor 1-gamma
LIVRQLHASASEWTSSALATLNSHLSLRTFLVGERITLADIVVASALFNSVSLSFDAPARAKFPNVIRHFETVINQPKLKDVFGEPTYVEKAVQFVPPAKEKTKEKKEKPAPAAAAPKAEKKPKPKAEEPEDDADEPLVPAEPKVKNPLDDLPKSPFNLEDWKRAYSNKDTRGPDGALEWFYQKSVPCILLLSSLLRN